MDAFAEIGSWRDEAEDEVVGGGEVVEVAGVEQDVVGAKDVDGEVFVSLVGGGVWGVAEDGVPAGIGVEEFAGWMRAELGFEMGAIFTEAGENLGSESVALGE